MSNDQNASHQLVFEQNCDLFASCVIAEYVRLPSSEQGFASSFMVELFATTKLHTLFRQDSLVALVENVFMDTAKRDFVLTVTDRFFVMRSDVDLDYRSTLERRLARVAHGGGTTGKSVPLLMPEAIHNSIPYNLSNRNKLEELLKENSWLVTIMMLFLTYPKIREIISDMVEAAKPAKK